LESNKKHIRELNLVASFIWQKTKKTITVDKLIEQVYQNFKVNLETAKIDTERFVNKYLEEGLLIKV
jgi:hypothetical protein